VPSSRWARNRFEGWSRCTMPSACAFATPAHACSTPSTTCATGSGPLASSHRMGYRKTFVSVPGCARTCSLLDGLPSAIGVAVIVTIPGATLVKPQP
jgi:hypothetical protein